MTDAKTGRFVVTHADNESAVLKDVTDGQVLTLSSNPGVRASDVLEATVGPEPPLSVTWRVLDVDNHFAVTVTHTDVDPSPATMDAVDGTAIGELSRRDLDHGEVHAITVDSAGTDDAVRDVLDDESVLVRAARLDAPTVKVRSTPGVEVQSTPGVEVQSTPGVVAVRYVQDR